MVTHTHSHLSPLDASKVRLNRTTNPKPVPVPESQDLQEMDMATDHMILVPWTAKEGWDIPKLVPYGPLPLMPSSSVLNYATECFEGLKVHRGYDGRLRLLRPEYNCKRMLQSAARVTLPAFDPQELLKLIHTICAVEAPKWLPPAQAGSALYIRPSLIGTDAVIGIKVPAHALLCIFLVYWQGPRLIASTSAGEAVSECGSRLLASDESVARAYPRGTGAAKIGANYGPTLLEHARAQKQGYDQVLWLFGPDRQITEAGGSNIFIIWTTPSGSLQIVTPPLDEDQLILAGNTRGFVLELSREMFSHERQDDAGKCDVLERKVLMMELEQAAEEGRLEGVFVTGTAWQIHPVRVIGINGREILIPVRRVPHVSLLKDRMAGIVYGKEESGWAQVVEEGH